MIDRSILVHYRTEEAKANAVTTMVGRGIADPRDGLGNTTRTLLVGMMQTPPYDRMFEQSRRVYSAKGISPTLHTQGGGGQEIKVLVEL